MDVESANAVLVLASNTNIAASHAPLVWATIAGNCVSVLVVIVAWLGNMSTPRIDDALPLWRRCLMCAMALIPLATMLGCVRLAVLIVNDPATWKRGGIPKLAFALVPLSLLTGLYFYMVVVAIVQASRQANVHKSIKSLLQDDAEKR